jgi:amylosucrase
VIAKECEIAYNATYMALMWDAVATKNTQLLRQGILSLPTKLDRATWLNYVRCHDDIGLGFDDSDIIAAGYQPLAHRRFLVEYFTGQYDDSRSRGQPFGVNLKTGDARISGSLASLVGLEAALEEGNEYEIDRAIKVILLMHSMICSFGGIPLLYYGDEIGSLNDSQFMQDENKAGDNRWIHRPTIDWEKAELRHKHGTPEQRIFDGLKKMIGVRKGIAAFADFNNRELIDPGNPHLFVFWRSNPMMPNGSILVVANFDDSPQYMELSILGNRGMFGHGNLLDLCSGESPRLFKDQLVVPPYHFYWLTDQRPDVGLDL